MKTSINASLPYIGKSETHFVVVEYLAPIRPPHTLHSIEIKWLLPNGKKFKRGIALNFRLDLNFNCIKISNHYELLWSGNEGNTSLFFFNLYHTVLTFCCNTDFS